MGIRINNLEHGERNMIITENELNKLKQISTELVAGSTSTHKMFEHFGFTVAMLPQLLRTIDTFVDENKKLKETIEKLKKDLNEKPSVN